MSVRSGGGKHSNSSGRERKKSVRTGKISGPKFKQITCSVDLTAAAGVRRPGEQHEKKKKKPFKYFNEPEIRPEKTIRVLSFRWLLPIHPNAHAKKQRAYRRKDFNCPYVLINWIDRCTVFDDVRNDYIVLPGTYGLSSTILPVFCGHK